MPTPPHEPQPFNRHQFFRQQALWWFLMLALLVETAAQAGIAGGLNHRVIGRMDGRVGSAGARARQSGCEQDVSQIAVQRAR